MLTICWQLLNKDKWYNNLINIYIVCLNAEGAEKMYTHFDRRYLFNIFQSWTKKTTVMYSMMFCKQMRLTYVMLVLLHNRLINNIKMEPRLSFEQQKAILKWYWRTENVVEVQRQWRREYRTDPPMRLTIARICDKFETHGIVCDVHKGRSGRPCTSTIILATFWCCWLTCHAATPAWRKWVSSVYRTSYYTLLLFFGPTLKYIK